MRRLLLLISIICAIACHAQFTIYNASTDVPYSVVKEVEYLMPNEIKDYNQWKAESPDMTDEICLFYINAGRAQDNLKEAPATIIDYHFSIIENEDEINLPDAKGAVNVLVEIINSTTKTIKDITLRFEFSDAYGRQLYDMKSGDQFCVLTFSNLPGRTSSNQYEDIAKSIPKMYNMLNITKATKRKLFYNSKVGNIKLHDVKIVYADGSTSTKAALFTSMSGKAVDLLKYGPLAPAMQFAHDPKESEETESPMVEPKKYSSEVFRSVERMPSFPGGEAALMKYINSHQRIPPETDNQGTVVVQFVVQGDGSIGEVKVVRGIDQYLDAEAIRLTKSLPNFVPGRHNGEPVNVWYTLPITFRRIVF